MKILFINSVVDYGSTGKIVRDLAEGAKGQGHEVLIIYGRGPNSHAQDTIKVSNNLELAFHYFATKIFDRHALHSKTSTKNIIDIVEEFSPDIIHIHNLHGYYINVPLFLEYINKKRYPTIWTLHDFWLINGSSSSYYDGERISKLPTHINQKTEMYPRSILFDRQEKNYNWKRNYISNLKIRQLVCVSSWQETVIENSYLRIFPITTINNGVSLDLFPIKSTKDKIESDKIKVLALSNIWTEKKGFEDIVKLSHAIDKNEIELSVVGLNEKQSKLFPSWVITRPRTEDVLELSKTYQEADIFINLSIEETLGMTVLESLASGTPVITYNLTALPTLINRSVGRIVEAGDIDGVIREIYNLALEEVNPKICRAHVKNKFNSKKMIELYQELYNQSLKEVKNNE